jgi:hypothetical protein
MSTADPFPGSKAAGSIRKGADKSLARSISLSAAQPKEFFLDGLKKLEQKRHKCVELRGEYVE